MTAPNKSNRDRYDFDARSIHETDSLISVIGLRRLNKSLQWYDWDALTVDTNWDSLTQTYTDMTEAVGHPNFFSAFRFYTLETATRLKISIRKFWSVSVISYDLSEVISYDSYEMTHICVSLDQGVSVSVNGKGVSVISLQTLVQASQSYQSHG